MEVAVFIGEGADEDAARALAERLNAPLTDAVGDGLTLVADGEGLSLQGLGLKYRGDYERMLPRISKGRLEHEMLAHIAKRARPGETAIDAAAGMGEDALILAACGYEVTLYEKNPVIAELLRDAMRRAEKNELLKCVVERMKLTVGDSTELIPGRFDRVDLVYLDPMFPARRKSGLINKKLQLMQRLEQPCVDEKAMLDAAASAHPKRIIIKRPLKGAYLADVKPHYTVKGKAIRYDCFAFPGEDSGL